MQEQVSLEQAIAALKKQYGPSMVMGFEEGKDEMAKTLYQELSIPKNEAKKVIEALVASKTIRWQSSPAGTPNQEGTMGMIVEEATWTFGNE